MAGLLAPVEIDASLDEWTDELSSADALVCLNVIHIAPWQVAEGLARGAQRVVAPGGFVYLYGPFKEGDATAASNLDFDASLRARNPEWGVRAQKDVEAYYCSIHREYCRNVQTINFECCHIIEVVRTTDLGDWLLIRSVRTSVSATDY